MLLRFGLLPMIADNPVAAAPNRFQVILGNRLVTCERDETSDLLLFFHRVRPGLTDLDLVVDLRDPPDWFLQPVGEWSEDLVRQVKEHLN
jgi:hypothetical protein